MFPVVMQQWTETERGWGRRPDGITLHLNRAHRDIYVNAFNAKHNSKKATPEEYTFADGEPTVIDVSAEAYEAIKQSGGTVQLSNEGQIKTLVPQQQFEVTFTKDVFNTPELRGLNGGMGLQAKNEKEAKEMLRDKLIELVRIRPELFFKLKKIK
jgi:hypothetical protein